MDDSRGHEVDDTSRPHDVGFFTIADDDHYLGLVAMVNSLRRQGHHDPVTVLDLGLTDAQRAELRGECTLVEPRPDSPSNPWLLAPQICQARPARVVVYLDADVIVTEPLGDLLEAAAQGAICAFPDVRDRWFPQWHEIFDLARRCARSATSTRASSPSRPTVTRRC